MKKTNLLLVLLIALFSFSCNENNVPEPDPNENINPKPKVAIKAVSSADDSIVFNIELSDATEAGYLVLNSSELKSNSFEPVTVYANATKLENPQSQDITVSKLDSEQSYSVIAYALNGDMETFSDIVLSDSLVMKTSAVPSGPVPSVTIEAKESTTSSISFKLTPQYNPYECCYKVFRKTADFKDKSVGDVIDNATYVTANTMENVITIDELIDDQTYVVYAVAVSTSAESGYHFELSSLEIATLPLDAPTTDIAKQTFEVDSLLIGSVRMYTLMMSNENYNLEMMLQSDYYFEPLIPVGTYILEQGVAPGEPGYIRDLDISLVDRKTYEEIPLHKGAVEVTFDNGTYSFDGHFITEANELIEYEATSDMAYPLDFNGCSALLYPDTNIMEQENGNDYFRLDLYLADGVTIESGTYSIANGKLKSDTKIVTQFAGKDTGEIELSEIEVVFSPRDENLPNSFQFKYTGTAVTADGYKINIVGEPYVDITEKPKPPLETIVWTSCGIDSWYFGDYPSGWYSNRFCFYFEAEGYNKMSFEIDKMGGSVNEVPEGFYGYNESAGPMLEIFFKKDGGTVLYFQDEGGVTITKHGENDYELYLELYEMGEERPYTATYRGAIDVEYWAQ